MRVLGVDLGIASCGWAVLETDGDSAGIVGAGVRCFDAPLVDKTGEPKSALRRSARGQRRVIRRRRQRMSEIRSILVRFGLLRQAERDALSKALAMARTREGATGVTPWSLRAAAHDRLLTAEEFAAVLGHIARHRGFRSNSKRDAGANAADETSKMKKAMEATREGLARYRSFGEMIALDPKFEDRKRNRDKDYSHTPKRSDLEAEVRDIFRAQQRLGSSLASAELLAEVSRAAFFQRPLADREDKVGPCPFEPGEKRTSRRAPSFELFRYLSKLATLRLGAGRAERAFTPDEFALAARGFGEQKSITFKTLRKLLGLDPATRFAGVAESKESLDVATRAGAAAAGTCALRNVLGEAGWSALARTPETLDRIAEILTFREDIDSIRRGLGECVRQPLLVDALVQAAGDGKFVDFSGAAHVSAKAARAINEGLREGLMYSQACERVGYDHAARREVDIKEINSPVTRRAFSEAIKQIREIERGFGPIDTFHIELARDVGKSAEEREKLTRGIETRNEAKDKRRRQAAEILGRDVSADELLRFELVSEQQFRCVYCDGAIAPDGFAGADPRYQVDHILPWSRFGDDSYLNKTLSCTRCNQEKRGRTPFEWFSADRTTEAWEAFVVGFERLDEMKGLKKRNLKLRDAASVEERFKARNLTDTRWATRLLADALKRMFPSSGDERRVFTRPGAITSRLRRAWGLESLKKIDGERVSDDRHHAVDAIVLAACTESLLQRMTTEIQRREREGRADDIFHVMPPWPHFREEARRVVLGEDGVGGVFVSRAERRRARGKAHDATVKQIREIDGADVVFERKAIEKLTEKDLERIPVPAPYGNIVDPKKLRDGMVESLRRWIEAKKPKALDQLPRSPKGDVIRKVRIATNAKIGVEIGGGTVDRGEMARVDVFRKADKKGKFQYFLVPIYPHEIATMDAPPMRAVLQAKPESEWPVIDASYEFLWSLYQKSWASVTKASGEVVEGYFRGLDRATGNIALSAHINSDAIVKGIGPKTLRLFQKFAVDRLGRLHEIERETRTWRGVACI